jgi:uncharacterized protein
LDGQSDLQGNLGMLAGFLLLTWTLAAFGEEIAYRGYLQIRITDVLGSGVVGLVVAVGGLLGAVRPGPHRAGDRRRGRDVPGRAVVQLPAASLRNLWAPVLTHGFSNTIGLVTFFLVGPVYGFW